MIADGFFSWQLIVQMACRAAATLTLTDAERRKGCSFRLIQRWEAAVASDEVGSRVAAHERRNGSTREAAARRTRPPARQEGREAQVRSDANESVCIGLGCRGPECDFADFPVSPS